MNLLLNQEEMSCLFSQDPSTKSNGGFQALLVSLQDRTDQESGRIFLTPKLRNRIRRYAFNYGQGGWENLLLSIFSRNLGDDLSGSTVPTVPSAFIDA